MKKLLILSLFSVVCVLSRGQIVFHEDFNSPSLGDSVITLFNGTHGFAENSRLGLFPGDYCDSAYIDVGDSIILETDAFSTVGLDTVYFIFKHICKVDYFDQAVLFASNDNGVTWHRLINEYKTHLLFPPGAPWHAQGAQFSAASYNSWYPADPTAVPQTNWWRREAFDLSAVIANVPQAKIRWVMIDDNFQGGNGHAGWYIDDIKVGFFQYLFNPQLSAIQVSPFCITPTTVSFSFHLPALGYTTSDSITVHLFFGDGKNMVLTMAAHQYGFTINSILHTYLLPGTFIPFVNITSNFGYSHSFSGAAVNIFSNCVSFTGRLYMDNNANCIYDSGDEPIRYRTVELWHNAVRIGYVLTDFLGIYVFHGAFPAGTNYDIKAEVLTASNLSFSCPASGVQSIVSGPTSIIADFAYTCSPGFDFTFYRADYMVRAAGGGRGFFNLGNHFCQQASSVFKHWFENKLSMSQTAPSYHFTLADTFYWNFNFMNLNTPQNVAVFTTPAVALTVGDSVDVYAEIEIVPGEINVNNNTFFRRVPVMAGFDPNDKSVFPEGNISPSQPLTYRIRFQNTGNDTAYNIFVLDTLSPLLDLNSLEILSASHPMSIDVVQSNVLKFNFYNILLPDSATNEPLSHGYILYTIKPLPGLPQGTVIENRAHIYFDWNPPITTNTTVSVIDTALAVSVQTVSSADHLFQLYPNPASEEITFSALSFSEEKYDYSISDALGKKVKSGKITSGHQTISLSSLANGVYYFRLGGMHSGISVKKIVVVRE